MTKVQSKLIRHASAIAVACSVIFGCASSSRLRESLDPSLIAPGEFAQNASGSAADNELDVSRTSFEADDVPTSLADLTDDSRQGGLEESVTEVPQAVKKWESFGNEVGSDSVSTFSDSKAQSDTKRKSRKKNRQKKARPEDTKRVVEVPKLPSSTTTSAAPEVTWASAGKTSDGNFQLMRFRNGEYRTLVVGSMRGFDPSALELIDRLSKHLSRNANILGGFDSLLVRTANPDGLRTRSVTTSAGIDLHQAFPSDGTLKINSPAMKHAVIQTDKPSTEVLFLVRLLRQFQPKRVVMIGRGSNDNGGIIYSKGVKDAARQFADTVDLHDYSLSRRDMEGSFERFVVKSDIEVISIQLPSSTTVENVWSRFGVWVPTLIADDVNVASKDDNSKR